jgi:hypothetical protein
MLWELKLFVVKGAADLCDPGAMGSGMGIDLVVGFPGSGVVI